MASDSEIVAPNSHTLDERVAFLMGWTAEVLGQLFDGDPPSYRWQPPLREPASRYVVDFNYAHGSMVAPPFSTDMRWAWAVVDAMRERGWSIFISDVRAHGESSHTWIVAFEKDGGSSGGTGWGKTAAAAICEGALLAVRRAR